MKFKETLSVQELADFIHARVVGTSKNPPSGINEIHKVELGDISFVDNAKYYDKMMQSDATYIIIDQEIEYPDDKVLLIVDRPFDAYNSLVKKYFPFVPSDQNIHPSAVIDDTAIIQPGVYIGPGVQVGAHSILHAGVSLQSDVIIGERCIIHSNSVLGGDAFYYHYDPADEAKYTKMESCGRVLVEDDVEIGSACTIDRGVSGDTIIGRGTKIDNSVHIAHGVVIGRNCLIAAQVGIAGKTHIRDNVKLWGQVGVSKSLTIGEGAEVYAQSGVPASIEGGKKYFGSPVDEAKTKMKEQIWIKRVEEMYRKLQDLNKKLDI